MPKGSSSSKRWPTFTCLDNLIKSLPDQKLSSHFPERYLHKGSFTNYMNKKTYIHGRGNVHESQLGIHTWSTFCQCGHDFNVVFIKLLLQRKIVKLLLDWIYKVWNGWKFFAKIRTDMFMFIKTGGVYNLMLWLCMITYEYE